MEKLKAKHDHKLTDILKVFIFGLFLIMPFLVFAPSLLYISFNPNAEAEETTINVDEYKQINFNQIVNNGNLFTFGLAYNDLLYYENTSTTDFGYLDIPITPLHNYRFSSFIDINVQANDGYICAFQQLDNTKQSLNYDYVTINQTYNNRYINVFTSLQNAFYVRLQFSISETINTDVSFYKTSLYDLTQMGLTNNEFESYYTKDYYEYTLSKPEVVKIGTSTETIKDVETQIANNWQQMWNKQIFKWTNETILYKGINAFSQTFGIFDNSYITNLITYELIIVMIYIVIDIILTMFKWLTHMIGEK